MSHLDKILPPNDCHNIFDGATATQVAPACDTYFLEVGDCGEPSPHDAPEPTASEIPPAELWPSSSTAETACLDTAKRAWRGHDPAPVQDPPAADAAVAPRRRGGAPRYLLAFHVLAGRFTLARLAARYLAEEVYGIQSPNTLDAKSRDLTAFVTWFVRFNGHGDTEAWLPRDTQAYLNTLERDGRAPTTVNRVFATLRRFAKWAHEQPGHVFERGGLPTRGVKALAVDEPDCKKLSRRAIHQLFKAADTLARSETRANARPQRNRAILAVLYYTGLRVSELVALRREQYQGSYLVKVARKGKSRSKGLYLVAECRSYLDGYLNGERGRDDPDGHAEPLFLPARSAGPRAFMTRQLVAHVLTHIAQEANKHDKQTIKVHPHQLRHTFGAEYREKTGSDTETAAVLGHTGLQYVGRYVRRSRDERENVLEEMFECAAGRLERG